MSVTEASRPAASPASFERETGRGEVRGAAAILPWPVLVAELLVVFLGSIASVDSRRRCSRPCTP
jgi:hypothetical protein